MSTRRTVNLDEHDGVELEHVVVDDPSWTEPHPTVLVLHGGEGRSDFQLEFAERLVRLGARGVALDVFGTAVSAGGLERTLAEMERFFADREALRARLHHVVERAAALDGGDPARVAATGFCFGGACVLDLARTGAPVRGVASFHGVLSAPGQDAPPSGEPITAKVLVLHGWDDPYAPPRDVEAFAREFSARGADWQLHAYGGVMHAFTSPWAQMPEQGARHDPVATDRAWRALVGFLPEALGPDGLSTAPT